MPNIKPEDVKAYIISLIGKYENQVEDVVKTSTKALSKQIKPELKGYSRKGGHLYRTGAYQRGWSFRTISGKNQFQIKTYNRNKPSLVHLLEFGHNPPMVKARAYPHVRQTELKYLQKLMEEIRKGVEEWH